MPRKDKKAYELLKQDATFLIGKSISATLEMIVTHTEVAAKGAKQATYDQDKITAVDSMIRCYIEGFANVVAAYQITGTNLAWLANNYHAFFNTGIDISMPYISFRSEHLNNNGMARLEVASRDSKLDWHLELYKQALEKNQTPEPKLQRHLSIITYQHQREYHKKLSTDVKI